MRTAITLYLIAATCMGQAQVWCPPGAEWKYDMIGFGIEGCGTDVYAGDTLIGGRMAKKIDRQETIHYFFSDTTIHTSSSHFTAIEGGVVHQYLLAAAEWDTLYWLTAPIGARWFPPGEEPDTTYCPQPGGMVEVVDTGSVVINGTSVSFREVYYLDMSGSPEGASFRIHERFGSISVGLPIGGCVISEWPYLLNTYLDDAGTFHSSGNPWSCPEWLSVTERDDVELMYLFPNPGMHRLRFHLSVPGQLVEAKMYDAQGREVLDAQHIQDRGEVEVSALSPGTYIIRVRLADGIVRHMKWVKQ